MLENALSHSAPVARWVELPAYRQREVAVRREDVDQSRTALRHSADSRRR